MTGEATTSRVAGPNVSPTQPRRRRLTGSGHWVAWGAGLATAIVGLVNIASALTLELPARLATIERIASTELVVAAHALTLPAGAALLVLSVFLAKARQRALWLTVAVLGAIGVLQLLKGLDVEEAVLSWSLGGLLVAARGSFPVRHEHRSITTALRRVQLFVAGAGAVTVAVLLATASTAAPHLSIGLLVREAGDLIIGASGPLRFHEAFEWVPLAIGLLWAAVLAASGWALFRPLRADGSLPKPEVRAAVERMVHEYGHDTLSAFKLRSDVQTIFSDDGRAFVSYRVDAGVLLVSGDPVGPADALPMLLERVQTFARERGLRLAAVGASAAFAQVAEAAGLRALYLGEEAIVETAGFTLEGRPIKKVRQAVHRVERAGYRAEIRRLAECDESDLVALERVSAAMRDGTPERGFSMAIDGLRGAHVQDSVVVVARDGAGEIRAFLHLVPTYGRPAMSLSAMFRESETPNGITEFLVVRGIERLREQGIEELSLNFAAFARWLHAPQSRIERLMGRGIRRVDPYFQIESLYRFNAKFFPRWQTRYLLYERKLGLPRTALATLLIEGLVQRPTLPRPRAMAVDRASGR